MTDHQSHRKSDSSLVYRAANSAILTLLYRTAMGAAVATLTIVLGFVVNRLITELDANTHSQKVLSTQMAVTSVILTSVVSRVDGLEARERNR